MQGNLHNVFYDLTDFQRSFIKRMVNLYGNQEIEVHQGNLIFFRRELVIKCLASCARHEFADRKDRAQAKKLLEKLEANPENESFTMRLDDRKVQKYSSGTSPVNRVVRLQVKMEVESGIRYNHFRGKYERVKDMVSAFANFQRVKPGLWKVTCKRTILDAAKFQIFERYGKT